MQTVDLDSEEDDSPARLNGHADDRACASKETLRLLGDEVPSEPKERSRSRSKRSKPSRSRSRRKECSRSRSKRAKRSRSPSKKRKSSRSRSKRSKRSRRRSNSHALTPHRKSRSPGQQSSGPTTQTDKPKASRARNSLDVVPVPEAKVKKAKEGKQHDAAAQKAALESQKAVWRPERADQVKTADGGKYSQDNWKLEPGALATVMEVNFDGDIRLRNPKGKVTEGFLARDDFVFVKTDKAMKEAIIAKKAKAMEEAWAQKVRFHGQLQPGRKLALKQERLHDVNFDNQPEYVQSALLSARADDAAFNPDSQVVQLALRAKRSLAEGGAAESQDKVVGFNSASKFGYDHTTRPDFPHSEPGDFVWNKAEKMKELSKGLESKTEEKNDEKKKDEKKKEAKKQKKEKKEKKPKLSKEEKKQLKKRKEEKKERKKLKQAMKEVSKANKRLQKLGGGKVSKPSSSSSSSSDSS